MSTINQLINNDRIVLRGLERSRRQQEAQTRTGHETISEVGELRSKIDTMLGILAQLSQFIRPTPTEHSVVSESEIDEPTLLISDEELRAIRAVSANPGNFAAKLVQRIFPELFTDANIRGHFNYNGGGHNRKQALSPTRKAVVKRCVIRFFPEVRNDEDYKAHCVIKINEILRRPVRPLRQDVQPLEPLDPLSPGALEGSLFDF